MEGGEDQFPGRGRGDALAGGVGACGVGQAELSGLLGGPKHLGAAPGGAGTLATDTHAEALEAAVGVAGTQVERAGDTLIAQAPYHVVLTVADLPRAPCAASLITAYNLLVGRSALPTRLDGVALKARGTALTAAARVAWGTCITCGLAICVQETGI